MHNDDELSDDSPEPEDEAIDAAARSAVARCFG